MKVRFQADANLDPDIGLGLQRRDASIDYRLALGVIPDGMVDPDVLAVAAEGGRVLVTNDLRMPKHFPNLSQFGTLRVFFSSLPACRSARRLKGCFCAGYRGPRRRCETRSDGCRANTGSQRIQTVSPCRDQRESPQADGPSARVALDEVIVDQERRAPNGHLMPYFRIIPHVHQTRDQCRHLASIAGILGERASSVEISFVHTVYHVDHIPDHSFARNIFGELVHVLEAFCDMAAGRVQSQGRGKETHVSMNWLMGIPLRTCTF